MSTQESDDGQSKYLGDRVFELETIVEEQKNLLVEKENRLEEKDKRLEGKNKQVEEKNKQLEEKDKQLEEKDQELEEKDKQLEEKDKRLKEKDDFIIKLLRELCDTRKVMKYRACNSDCVTACLVCGFMMKSKASFRAVFIYWKISEQNTRKFPATVRMLRALIY